MFEFLIRQAMLMDGTGAPAVPGDLAVKDGKIAAIGHLQDAPAREIVDAGGRVLTPGFLDIHRHGDAALFHPDYGRAELMQGLTTVIHGNCGLSLAPAFGPWRESLLSYLQPITGPVPEACCPESMASYLQSAGRRPAPLHSGILAGMGTMRACVAGLEAGDLTDGQFHQLHRLMEQVLADGAVGVSMGLGYAPECFYTTEGLIRALEPLAGTDVPVTVHMRQEGDGVVAALEEMLQIARRLDLYLEISHLKAIGKRNWGKAVPQMLQLLTRAREEGVRVACDVYPYPAGSTQLIHTLPTEYQSGGNARLTELLRDPVHRQRIRERIETGSDFENIIHLVGFDRVLATNLKQPENRALEGKSLEEIAALQHKDPYDALFDLLVSEHCTASMIDYINAEDDIDRILQAPFSSVISDATYPTVGLCHPRVYGTCARLLETYVKKRHLLTLEEAVHKLTGLPAARLGLRQKGRLEVGCDADLCLFDPDAIRETGTWQNPASCAEGMDWVFVSGTPAIREGVFRPGNTGSILTAAHKTRR